MDLIQLPNEEIREMLRDSLRGFLGEQWNANAAEKHTASPEEISAIWTRLVGQGVAALGCDFSEGGLREILVVMAELGRTACPAPMWSAALANLGLSGSHAEAAVNLLEKLHAGTARVAFSFGALDPDPNTGSVRITNGSASGLLRFVEVAGSCTHLLVTVEGSALGLIELGASGVDLEPTRAMGAWGLYEIRLNFAPATLIELERSIADDLLLEGKLALMARAYGAARRRFAWFLLDEGGAGLPQYDLGSAGNELRKQARRWLDENWSGERKAAFDTKPFCKREFDPQFALDIGKTGWIGLGWPKQFGGQARSPQEQLAFIETMERGEAPRIGAAIQANALMMFGTPDQQRKYLPEILRGEAMHGMGYSEPQAGSDLAALRPSAVRDGEEWAINRQKIWATTGAA